MLTKQYPYILADTLGAIFSLGLFWWIRPDRIKEEK